MLKVALVSTVRAPIKELAMFVNYHLNVGIDEILLFFDDPLDEGLKFFANYEGVTVTACTRDYWNSKCNEKPDYLEKRQVINANVAITLAKAKACDWITHIDGDELLHPLKPIKEVLADTEAIALRFSMLEALSENESYDNIFMPNLFKVDPGEQQLRMAESLGCSSVKSGRPFFKGHIESKMIYRICPEIGVIGIHAPININSSMDIRMTREIRLLHFDCIGFKNWKNKWLKRIDGSVTNSVDKQRALAYSLE